MPMLSFSHLQPTVQKEEKIPEVVAEIKEEAPKKPRTRAKKEGEADANTND